MPRFPISELRPGSPDVPWLTADLPSIGGHLAPRPDDFQVDEIPAYPPSGEGDHWFVRVRKRDLTTDQAREIVARAAGVHPRSMGVAGQKDKTAVTTQWMSLPAEPVPPDDPRVELLERDRNPRKLRRGHVAGNRFRIRLLGTHPDASQRLPVLLERLARGFPNYFGPQRFGGDGRLLDCAYAFVESGRRPPGNARFALSVLQSAVFNRWLGARVTDGLLHRAVLGDIMRKRATGGLFCCQDLADDEERARRGEIDPTGPMIGPKTMPASDAAGERERAACIASGLEPESADRLGRLAPGTRRVSRVIPTELQLDVEGDVLHAAFVLPSGSYATVFLAELAHPQDAQLRAQPTPAHPNPPQPTPSDR